MVVIDKIRKSFDGKKVLDDLSYTFEDNCCYYIKGLSGAGKTTLMNILYGYETMDSGSIDINSATVEYMFQEPLVFNNLSIKENLQMKYAAAKGELCTDDTKFVEALRKVDLDMSIDTLVNTLSGGEKQRLQLAQYTLCESQVLILDEPACKLDYDQRVRIYSLINDIFKDTIRLIITHDEEVMQIEGVKLELREGKLWEV